MHSEQKQAMFPLVALVTPWDIFGIVRVRMRTPPAHWWQKVGNDERGKDHQGRFVCVLSVEVDCKGKEEEQCAGKTNSQGLDIVTGCR